MLLLFFFCLAHLGDWNDGWYHVEEEIVPVVLTELWQREAHDVEDQVEEVVHGQRAHQQVEVPHHLQTRISISPIELELLIEDEELAYLLSKQDVERKYVDDEAE